MDCALEHQDFQKRRQQNIFLFNFGGPEKEEDVFPFLVKLFSDPFIIRSHFMPSVVRHWLANKIAKKRCHETIEQYKKINFSPINAYTKIQAQQLEAILQAQNQNIRVHVVNRYTKPFASDVLEEVDLKNGRNYFLSLYPHLCHSTTVSSFRDFDLQYREKYGSIDFVSTRIFSWWHEPSYIKLCLSALQEKLTHLLQQQDGLVTVLFSAHGLPLKYYNYGDPYVEEINAHFFQLASQTDTWLNDWDGGKHSSRIKWHLSFQSRVGPVEWTKPYTESMIQELGAKNKGAILLVPISFTSDHIETLFEMDVTYRDLALNNGFHSYARAAVPNANKEFSRCLASILTALVT